MHNNITLAGFSNPQQSSSRFLDGSMKIELEQFKKYLTVKGLSPKSVKTYCSRFMLFQNWLVRNELRLSKRSIEEFIYQKKQQGYSNSAINSYINALNYLARCYKSYGFLAEFIDDLKSLPKKKSEMIPLSLEECEQLISTRLSYKNRNGVDCSNLDHQYLTLTEFILLTGCRYHEASSLKIGQLDVDGGTAFLTDTKTKQPRYLFFEGIIKSHLRVLIRKRNPDELVFTNSRNKEIHSGDFWHNLRNRAKAAGITKKIHPHLLRHTYATLFYRKTHDISMVAKLLGHKDIKTTHDTYVHTDIEEVQRASKTHPLMSKYLSPDEVLADFKKSVDNLGVKQDLRFKYDSLLKNNELVIHIKTIKA